VVLNILAPNLREITPGNFVNRDQPLWERTRLLIMRMLKSTFRGGKDPHGQPSAAVDRIICSCVLVISSTHQLLTKQRRPQPTLGMTGPPNGARGSSRRKQD